MATLKEFEEALRAAGNTAALEILDGLRARDRATRSIRPARRLTGRKMTPELAEEILRLHHTTEMTQQEIAFELGVNQGRVNEVIKRGKWLDGDPAAPEAVSRDKAVERARRGKGFTPEAPPPPAVAAPEPEPEPAPEPAPEPPPSLLPQEAAAPEPAQEAKEKAPPKKKKRKELAEPRQLPFDGL